VSAVSLSSVGDRAQEVKLEAIALVDARQEAGNAIVAGALENMSSRDKQMVAEVDARLEAATAASKKGHSSKSKKAPRRNKSESVVVSF
jgi:hypothetical protein